MLLDRSKEFVEKLYIEPKNEIIIGNFLTSAAETNNQHTQGGDTRRKKKNREATTRLKISQK